MRSYLTSAVVAALLLVPAAAIAQDVDDPCYVDPTAPECIEVGADDGEVGADDGEVGADDGVDVGGVVVDDGAEVGGVGGVDVEVLGETIRRADAAGGVLSRTGLETGAYVAVIVALLALGSALLFTTRRRRSA